MEPIDVSTFCLWEVEDTSPEKIVVRCQNPLVPSGFCDYCDIKMGSYELEECPHFQKLVDETSEVEEEVRQYLEYTESRKE